MFSNPEAPIGTTRHYALNSQPNSRSNSSSHLFDRSPSKPNLSSASYLNNRSDFAQTQYPMNSFAPTSPSNYVPPSFNRHSASKITSLGPSRNNSSGGTGKGGAVEKTNMMSSENPFVDPARPYEQFQASRTITSITSPRKPAGGISKSLNLSDENPFSSTYGRYQYPTQIDTTKRITNQMTTAPSNDNKSLSLSDENPFQPSYGRYHYPSQIDLQKRITELPKPIVPSIPLNDLADDNPFNSYQPTTIREYSIGGGSGSSSRHRSPTITGPNGFSISTSIGEWVRNNPAPLSYRPIQVQRPPQDFYARSDTSTSASYVPPSSQSRESSPPPRLPSHKITPSIPLEKTSLNMSPENPFAATYGRYHYPSQDEIKSQKRIHERPSNRPVQSPPIREKRSPPQATAATAEYPDTEKKETVTGKGPTKFARFDVDL